MRGQRYFGGKKDWAFEEVEKKRKVRVMEDDEVSGGWLGRERTIDWSVQIPFQVFISSSVHLPYFLPPNSSNKIDL